MLGLLLSHGSGKDKEGRLNTFTLICFYFYLQHQTQLEVGRGRDQAPAEWREVLDGLDNGSKTWNAGARLSLVVGSCRATETVQRCAIAKGGLRQNHHPFPTAAGRGLGERMCL